jgi:hypothetical protein
MKMWLSTCCLTILVVPIAAQSAAPQTGTPAAPTVVTMTMSSTIVSQYKEVKRLYAESAAAMPAGAYSFQPTPEMRTFAGDMGHILTLDIAQCGSLLGRKHALAGVDLSKTLTTKTDIVKTVADAFAFCDEYFLKLDDSTPITETYVTMKGQRNGQPLEFKVSNGASIVNFLTHNNEEYGYIAVYLRLKGIVPPSSVPHPPAGQGGSGAQR